MRLLVIRKPWRLSFFAELYFKEVYHLIKEHQDAYGAELQTFPETGAKIEIVTRRWLY